MERGPTERIATKRAEAALVRTSTAGYVDGNGKERRIVRTQSEVVCPRGAAGGEVSHPNQIRSIRPSRSSTGLLHSRVHRERRSRSQRGDVQKLPARRQRPGERPKKAHTI